MQILTTTKDTWSKPYSYSISGMACWHHRWIHFCGIPKRINSNSESIYKILPKKYCWINLIDFFCIVQHVNLCAWTLSLATMSFSVFGGHRYYQLRNPGSTALEFGLFVALTRIAWPIAVCYITFACARNCGGPVNWFLSHPYWQPFARLSYAVYLIHFPLIQVIASSDFPPNFEEMKAFQLFNRACTLSFLVAIPATLAFISPLDTIDKLIFASDKKSQNQLRSRKFEFDRKLNAYQNWPIWAL